MIKYLFVPFVLMLLILTSCSKDLITPLDPDSIAVVESYIVAGDSAIRVRVSRLLPFSTDTNEAIEYIPGLTLQINGFTLSEPEPGHYELDLKDTGIQPGSSYTLKFLYASDTVSSSTTIPGKPVNFSLSDNVIYTDRITSTSGFIPGHGDDIDATWDNEDGSYYYLTIQYLESTPDYINSAMEDVELPMEQGVAPINSSGTRIGLRNLQFFGHYRVVLFRVNKDFADLYQHLTSNSNNLTNPVTSISNGYGVFTGMSSDTLYLEVKEN